MLSCRGGAFNSALLGCKGIAVLPEEMSKERFAWLKEIGSEVYATPGCESNVKEVFDKNNELVKEGDGKVVSFNQFAEFGNPLWHFYVTGQAMEEVFNEHKTEKSRFSAVCLTQGSAGTLGCGEYLRKKYPSIKVCASEADQCPTMLENGFGGHRIEGIGDKHIPWIMNMKNIDMVVDIDDEDCIATMNLFNTKEGHEVMKELGVPSDFIENANLLGISSIANMLTSIKIAKYYEFNENDVVFSLCTDSMEMYQSRILEGVKDYTTNDARIAYFKNLRGQKLDRMLELSHYDKKRIHNLKYFTWIEQQGMPLKELDAQWFDEDYWEREIGFEKVKKWDANIKNFNKLTGLE